jgi:putative oxidoreductase
MERTKIEKVVSTTHRVLLSLIFLVAGLGHMFNTDKIVMKMARLPAAPLLEMLAPLSLHAIASGIILVLGGLGLLLGFKTKISSLILILVLIPITITVQLEGGETIGPLFKNIGLLGGLIYFSYFGAWGWSIDKQT